MVGNGFCNDETNNAECNYDGGECCDLNANKDYCSQCACNFLEICTDGYHPLVQNGFCNDETNNFDCNYDGGDCCVNLNTNYCSDCNCLGGGLITSPGFPGNYGKNLNLTWLIQVPIGQSIEINFLSFDLESHSSGYW